MSVSRFAIQNLRLIAVGKQIVLIYVGGCHYQTNRQAICAAVANRFGYKKIQPENQTKSAKITTYLIASCPVFQSSAAPA